MKKNMLLILIISFAFSGWSQANENNKPNLSTTYEQMFQAVWDKAAEGELPVYECERVVGTASKMLSEKKDQNGEAQQAYKACYVDAILHYTDAFFNLRNNSSIDSAENKPYGCELYTRYLTGHVMSLEAYADRFDLSVTDLNKQINERLSETASLCQVELN
ncbi:MAG TPA: hypothetical protein GX719_00390 [Gammaproteobacteria bacterium]|nr:hypothetical protein [Gammaproteobacteria bacterium]